MSLSSKVDNRKDILILVKGPTQGLGEHSLSAEKRIQSISLKLIQNIA